MTAARQVPEAPPLGKERVAADVPADVGRRLRMWAALRRKPAAHIVSELVCQGVPTAEQLAAQMQHNGAGNGRADR
jgi:hypothetical protein